MVRFRDGQSMDRRRSRAVPWLHISAGRDADRDRGAGRAATLSAAGLSRQKACVWAALRLCAPLRIGHGCDSADRKDVVSGKSVSVRVDPGGPLIIKKKNPR